jgi:predicted acetyltransferase
MENARKIEVLPATPQHRPLLRNLFELYCHDFSPMTGEDVQDTGLYTGEEFRAEWPESGWHPFLVTVDRKWAGFAWVVTNVSYVTPGADHVWMDEFFVMRKYRRQGVGERVAHYLFEMFPGTWEVGEIPENVEAQAFWRKIIHRYTGGQFQEISNNARWRGPVQIFTSPSAQRG